MFSQLRKSSLVLKIRPCSTLVLQRRLYTSQHGDSTLGRGDKAAFLLEDLRKARNMIEDMQRDHAESRVVFHEAHKSIQSALQQTHNDMKELISAHSQTQGESVESLRSEVQELKKLLKEFMEAKK